MNNLNFYSTIFKRKSIRRFVIEPLEKNILDDINNQIKKLESLFENIKTEVIVLGEKEIGGIFSIKAPHYIAIYSEEKEGFLLNAGFILQQMDLYLSYKGLGSLWLGMGKPQEKLSERNGLKYVITLCFGKTDEKVHRDNLSEFKRKPLNEISSADVSKEIIESVRFAPSSTNNQPWYLDGKENNINVYRKKLSFVKNTFFPLMKKFTLIDIGIALLHMKISIKHLDKNVDFINENHESLKEYEYIISAKISN